MALPNDFQNTDLAALWLEMNSRSSVIIFQNVINLRL
jgi:hypothetical protein